jgi:hypothetical protein
MWTEWRRERTIAREFKTLIKGTSISMDSATGVMETAA